MNPARVNVVIDSHVRIPLADLTRPMASALKAAFTHANPDFHKKRRMGFATFGVESNIKTWSQTETHLVLPRGATGALRTIAEQHGASLVFEDRRVAKSKVKWPEADAYKLRPYQVDALRACIGKEQGLVRAPTGSGKTTIALALAATLGQPVLVIMRDSNLLKQWQDRAVAQLGIPAREIGVLRGGVKNRIGPRLTLALQQTLNSGKFPLETVANEFGAVIVDEVHGVAAKTFQVVIDKFAARYRFGFSADETRRDKREFLVYDQFGAVLYEVTREELERDGVIVPVIVRMVPTEFAADWYRDAASGDRDFGRLLDEITADESRNEQACNLIASLVRDGDCPVFGFTHRVEHARWVADTGVFARGVSCGLMLGGAKNSSRFDDGKRRLNDGTLDAAIGTYNAIGTGLDVPRVRAGVMLTPIGRNRQFFNQVRGRMCRPYEGKTTAHLYVLWDRDLFPDAPDIYASWDERVEVLDDGEWVSNDDRRRRRRGGR